MYESMVRILSSFQNNVPFILRLLIVYELLGLGKYGCDSVSGPRGIENNIGNWLNIYVHKIPLKAMKPSVVPVLI